MTKPPTDWFLILNVIPAAIGILGLVFAVIYQQMTYVPPTSEEKYHSCLYDCRTEICAADCKRFITNNSK